MFKMMKGRCRSLAKFSKLLVDSFKAKTKLVFKIQSWRQEADCVSLKLAVCAETLPGSGDAVTVSDLHAIPAILYNSLK